MRLYVDSNVLISFINREFGGGLEFMEYRVGEFFSVCSEDKHTIVLSEYTLTEIRKCTGLPRKEIIDMLKNLNLIVEYKDINWKIIERRNRELKEIQQIHRSDRAHVIMALESKCDCIVTWNTRDLEVAKNLIAILPPSEFT